MDWTKFTPMQQEYVRNANHRWNIKTGATGSGKTFLDYSIIIPKRIINCKGKGLIILIGNTKNSVERNVLTPMREWWGDQLVGSIRNNDNTTKIFGKKCIVMGADKVNQVARIQGATVEYCYGDEVSTWNKEVFEMLKSRLRTENSKFDGTCNPASPKHWFKQFLDSNADIYQQSYTIDDNPFLPDEFVKQLKQEYFGTVYYDRYILGKWKSAEGIIYRMFSDHPTRYFTDRPKYDYIQVGLDFGGNHSAHTIVASGLTYHHKTLTGLASWRLEAKDVTPNRLYEWVQEFLTFVSGKYGTVLRLYADSAEQTLIAGLRKRLAIPVINSIKNPILDRIRCVVGLIALNKFYYTKDCQTLKDALSDAVYNDKSEKDQRLDNGTSDIDTLDAFEYSFENKIRGYARNG